MTPNQIEFLISHHAPDDGHEIEVMVEGGECLSGTYRLPEKGLIQIGKTFVDISTIQSARFIP